MSIRGVKNLPSGRMLPVDSIQCSDSGGPIVHLHYARSYRNLSKALASFRSRGQHVIVSSVLWRLDFGPCHTSSSGSVNVEYRCSAGVFIVQVRPRHSTPSSATVAESTGADSIQACHSGFANGTTPTNLVDELFQPKDLRLVISIDVITACLPYMVIELFRFPVLISGPLCSAMWRRHHLC